VVSDNGVPTAIVTHVTTVCHYCRHCHHCCCAPLSLCTTVTGVITVTSVTPSPTTVTSSPRPLTVTHHPRSLSSPTSSCHSPCHPPTATVSHCRHHPLSPPTVGHNSSSGDNSSRGDSSSSGEQREQAVTAVVIVVTAGEWSVNVTSTFTDEEKDQNL
jgi:hypothetical protein